MRTSHNALFYSNVKMMYGQAEDRTETAGSPTSYSLVDNSRDIAHFMTD